MWKNNFEAIKNMNPSKPEFIKGSFYFDQAQLRCQTTLLVESTARITNYEKVFHSMSANTHKSAVSPCNRLHIEIKLPL